MFSLSFLKDFFFSVFTRNKNLAGVHIYTYCSPLFSEFFVIHIHRSKMRRAYQASKLILPLLHGNYRRSSTLPPATDKRWAGIGKEISDFARSCDTGKQAFEECKTAREQLECVIQSVGYDMNVFTFGGLVTLGLFEAGGDVDFVGILDVEPELEECGVIVSRVSRELRRFGIKCRALSRARVPVVKADRVSRALPGSPLHTLSSEGIFQFSRQLEENECFSLEKRLTEKFSALDIEWNSSHQLATVRFSSTAALVYALTHLKSFGEVEIPLRVPVDPKHGPELFRFPFDFCLSSTGLRNSYVLRNALLEYPYSRHLLLAIKKWGRETGIVNPIDGFLASYALTIMLVHFLAKSDVISKVASSSTTVSPSMNAEYTPLMECASENDANQVGFLFAKFLEYYAEVFDYKESVVCTSNVNLSKAAMGWNRQENTTGHPPFFEFCIKDPFGLGQCGAKSRCIFNSLCERSTHARPEINYQ
ncbi:hypothetical protein AGDE_04863 [Angomonas deanei]|nr:hypothetical protein AGDE_04863 [Angomonas deanei]|eukprot:EPY39066.1 hypothetical protein AGDE_04863 [Angomonas deanei]